MVRHRGGGDEVFLDVVEPAAMDLPFLTIGPGGEVAVAVQAKVEGDEVEGRADPRDGGDHMHPARGDFHPVPQDHPIIHGKPPL